MATKTAVSKTVGATGGILALGAILFGILTTPAYAAVAPKTETPVQSVVLNEDGSLTSFAG